MRLLSADMPWGFFYFYFSCLIWFFCSMSYFFFSIYLSNFSGGLILSAYLRQFFKILNMCGFVKSESLISSISFLYWFISDYLANPLDSTVSITLNGMSSALMMHILLPYFIKHPTYELFYWVIFTCTMLLLNLTNGKLLICIYFGILKQVCNC